MAAAAGRVLGSALLAAVVIGSGIAAQQLSPGQTGLELFENAAATAAGLFALILMVGPVSGAHFNPVVSFVDAAFGGLRGGRRSPTCPPRWPAASAGRSWPTLMFCAGRGEHLHPPPGQRRRTSCPRSWPPPACCWSSSPWPAPAGRHLAAAAVGAYIGAAYFFTSSTSFANPAITVGRMFSNTFAGIAPSSVPGFVGAQIIGGLVAFGLIRVFYPDVTPAEAANVVIPHPSGVDLVDPQPNGSTGSPDATTSDPPDRSGSVTTAHEREVGPAMHLVAIGGSDAGISAALRARELDPAVEVTVVVADAYPNFSICGIPYYISGEVTHWRNLAHRSYADLEATGMRLRLDTLATGIDVADHRVWLRNPDGREEPWPMTAWWSAPAPCRSDRRSAGWTDPTPSARPTGCTCCTPWATPSPCSAPWRRAPRPAP